MRAGILASLMISGSFRGGASVQPGDLLVLDQVAAGQFQVRGDVGQRGAGAHLAAISEPCLPAKSAPRSLTLRR